MLFGFYNIYLLFHKLYLIHKPLGKLHLYYKVLIDGIEIAIFDSDNETYLANFIHTTLQGYVKRIEIIAGYYDGNDKWHNYEDIEEEDC